MSGQIFRNTRLGGIAVLLLVALSGCARLDYGPSVQGSEPPTRGVATVYAAAPAGYLRVQSGDNLYALAKRHGVPLRQLIDVNRLRAPYVIRPGQLLKMPRGRYHIVRSSETVYAIANRYDVDMGSLVRINRIEPPYRVEKGQKLRLPDKNTAASRSSRTLVPRSVKGPGTLPATPPRREATLTPRWRNPGTGPLRAPPKRSAGKFLWPVKGRIIVGFGPRKGGYRNDGINIAASKGTAIRAVENGVVAYTGNQLQGFGNLVLIKHSGRWMSAYAHGSVILVKRGQIVRRGQIIARVGNSGNVTRPQLHFELRRGDEPVDPKRYLVRFAWALPITSIAFLDVPPGPE